MSGNSKTALEALDAHIAIYEEGRGNTNASVTLALRNLRPVVGRLDASSQAEIERLRTVLQAMLSRFELYAGENDIHAGHHDKALLDAARAALSGSKE
jgi:hypothetical protein